MAKVDVKFRVKFIESERGWGQNTWYQYYDTRAEAVAAQKKCWSKITAASAPDWYITCEAQIDVVEASEATKC